MASYLVDDTGGDASRMPPKTDRTRQQRSEAMPDKNREEERRLAELDYLDVMRPDPDHVLQEIVDEVRLTFQTELCMVNLDLSDVQYFRASALVITIEPTHRTHSARRNRGRPVRLQPRSPDRSLQ